MDVEIPDSLKLFSGIYEYRLWILIPILLIGIFLFVYSLTKRNRCCFLLASLCPFVFLLCNFAAAWCGWHYRMELRDRYAVVNGTAPYSDEQGRAINIDRMPPNVRKEYAKHDYHPRHRDLKALTVGMILLTPFILAVLFAIGLPVFRKKIPDQSN